jgi:tetratricopeptide (TPR) repeat protein
MLDRIFALVIFVALLTAAQPPAVRAADTQQPQDTVLAFPFENVAKRPEYNWIGESFSEMLSELIDLRGFITVRPDERNLAYERESLPSTAILTHATSIKVGERAGADMIIIGTYRVDGDKNNETITATARLIDIREGRVVGREFNRGGPLRDLQRIQGELAYDILLQRNPALPFSRDQFVTDATKVPAEAFSDFMKAVLTSDRKNKILFLERAIDTYAKAGKGSYSQAVFELGAVYYADNAWNDAIKWLARVEPSYARYPEAAFFLGVAYLATGQKDKAVQLYSGLVPRLPLYEVYGNAGIAYLRASKVEDAITYLRPAAEAATRDADTQFNYGYALWLKNDFSGVATQMQAAIARKPQDGEAYYLLGKANERMGKTAEAATAYDQAKRYLSTFAQWETRQRIPDLARVKSRFSKSAYYRLVNDARGLQGGAEPGQSSGAPGASGSASVDDSLKKAQDDFTANRDKEALDGLARILQVRPDSHEAHFLRGRIYERRGEYDRAVEALKAATFWNPRLLQAYVILGRIYTLQKNCADARAAATKALQLDPASSEAGALKRLVDSKCAPGT